MNSEWTQLEPAPSFFLFEPFDSAGTDGYSDWLAVNKVIPVNVTGIVTARDDFVIDIDREALRSRIEDMRSMPMSDDAIREKYFVGKGSSKYPPGDSRGWKLPEARWMIREDEQWDERYTPVLYRPFDIREMYYVPWMVDWPRKEAMPHLIAGENVALIVCRQQARSDDEWTQVFITSRIAESCTISNTTREINYLFPLYLYPRVGKSDGSLFHRWTKGKDDRTPNLDSKFVEQIEEATELRFVHDGREDLKLNFGPEDVLSYIYAVFHSPSYRERYEAHLKLDFPRIPLPSSANLFRSLVALGHDLLALHLLESPRLDDLVITYTGPPNPVVGRVAWSEGTVWLDAGKASARDGHRATGTGTIGFHLIPEEVWDLQIGSYQVCHKWLKDRKGRILSSDEINHYRKIVTALCITSGLMSGIDRVIDSNGGWPGAFLSNKSVCDNQTN